MQNKIFVHVYIALTSRITSKKRRRTRSCPSFAKQFQEFWIAEPWSKTSVPLLLIKHAGWWDETSHSPWNRDQFKGKGLKREMTQVLHNGEAPSRTASASFPKGTFYTYTNNVRTVDISETRICVSRPRRCVLLKKWRQDSSSSRREPTLASSLCCSDQYWSFW